MAGLAVLLTLMGQVGVLGPIQGLYLTATEPLDRTLTGVFRPFAGLLSDLGDLEDIREENRLLRIENEDLRNQLVELEQDRERISQLEAALGISQSRTGEQREFANVVNRRISPFTEVISIDKGSSSGLREGMVVLSPYGTLLGSVVEVFNDHAFVRTINDSRSRVLVQVVETGIEGTVKGTANRQLELDLASGAVNAGQNVVTSALSGRYPPGIPVGVISSVAGSPQDLFPTVKIEPAARVSAVTTVIVITSFLPQQQPAGDG
jgi:rod shape-determining protein MreC